MSRFVVFDVETPNRYNNRMSAIGIAVIEADQNKMLYAFFDMSGISGYTAAQYGDTDIYVSPGASGWGFPFRTEAGCHYEVVTLEPDVK